MRFGRKHRGSWLSQVGPHQRWAPGCFEIFLSFWLVQLLCSIHSKYPSDLNQEIILAIADDVNMLCLPGGCQDNIHDLFACRHHICLFASRLLVCITTHLLAPDILFISCLPLYSQNSMCQFFREILKCIVCSLPSRGFPSHTLASVILGILNI